MTLFSISSRWQDILESTYQSLPNGYRISDADRKQIDPEGKGAVYGEILYESMANIFKLMNLTEEDVFVDLGSGVGKVVFQAGLTQPIFKVKGIELSKDRFNTSVQVFDQLSTLLEPEEVDKWTGRVELIHGDILQQNYSDVSHAFMCTTCFRDNLIAQIFHCKVVKHKTNIKY